MQNRDVALSKSFLVVLTFPICCLRKLTNGVANLSCALSNIRSISSSTSHKNLANSFKEFAIIISSSVKTVPRQSNWKLAKLEANVRFALDKVRAASTTSWKEIYWKQLVIILNFLYWNFWQKSWFVVCISQRATKF